MVKLSTGAKTNSALAENDEINRKGLMLAILAIPVGIVLWVILWNFGFIASIVSFAIAWLAVYLYKLGAKKEVGRRAAPYLLAIVLLGIVLAFLSGVALDALKFYVEGTDLSELDALFTADYWSFFFANILTNGELWSSYAVDIIISIVFGVLGCFSIVKSLFSTNKSGIAKAK
jgi:hypothetical protein